MAETDFGVSDVDPVTLTGVVRRALHSDTVEITDWQHTRLHYSEINPASGGLYRFAGSGKEGEKLLSWAVVLKIACCPEFGRAGASSHHAHWNYWKREVLAYQSGLLVSLPPGLTAPRCYGITEPAADVAWLWLEEITDTVGGHWPLSRYRLAARHLGRFNGAYLAGRPPPSFPWLSQGWLHSWVADRVPECKILEQPDLWEHPLVRPAFPRSVADRVLRLCAERERLLDALDQLPQTLCHWDAWRPNLFARTTVGGEEETVAVDWAFVGSGPIGTEVGQLVAMALVRGEMPPVATIDLTTQALDGYLEGLSEAGWRGDPGSVRFGAAALIALRWGLMLPHILAMAVDDSRHAWVEQTFGQPVGQWVHRWGTVSDFLLDQADSAWSFLG